MYTHDIIDISVMISRLQAGGTTQCPYRDRIKGLPHVDMR